MTDTPVDEGREELGASSLRADRATDATHGAPTGLRPNGSVSTSAGQFICFFDSGATGNEENDRVPIATGASREEALQAGIPRMLRVVGGDFWAMQYGSIATVAQPNLTADEFAQVGQTIETFFAEQIQP